MFSIAIFIILLLMQFGVFMMLINEVFDKSAQMFSKVFFGILLASTSVFCFYLNKFIIAMIA